jgi:transcriptional antiterminator RfaH
MKHWYVVTTKTGHGEQERAENNLLSQMIETYNPKVQVETIKRGKVVVMTKPMFTGYLFVNFDPTVTSAATINSTYGVGSLVTFGNVLVKIVDGVIDSFKERLGDKQVIISDLPKSGETVEINSGPLKGWKAIFKEPCGIKRSLLMITALGRKQQIEVDNTLFC